MSEHLSDQNIEQLLRRELTPQELLRADDHLAACTACRLRASAWAPTEEQAFESVYAALYETPAEADDHLAYEQIAAFIDGELDVGERESVESHLSLCASCAAETDDLRGLRTALAASDEDPRGTAPKFAEKARAFWFRLIGEPSRHLALAAIAVLILLALSATLFMLWHSGRKSDQMARSQPEPTASASNAQSASSPTQVNQNGSTSIEQPTPVPTESPTPENENASGEIAVTLNDGGVRVTMDRQGNLQGLEQLPETVRREVSAALMRGQVETPASLAQLRGKPGTLMGGSGASEKFALRNPVGALVRSERPTFRWNALDGASEYTVMVFDMNYQALMSSPPLKGTEWTVASALKRGQIYIWQVRAVKDGKEVVAPAPPAPEARFKILDQAQANELTRLEHERGNSHLTLGVLYARAGLLDDAEREFRALIKANPQSTVARNLLQSVEARRRRAR